MDRRVLTSVAKLGDNSLDPRSTTLQTVSLDLVRDRQDCAYVESHHLNAPTLGIVGTRPSTRPPEKGFSVLYGGKVNFVRHDHKV